MTSAVERLEAISRSWRLQHDALKIVRREVFRKTKGGDAVGLRFSNTEFEEAKPEVIDHDIQDCQQSVADFTVLSMWAVFERLVFERLEAECIKMQALPVEVFNQGVTSKVIDSIEYWKIDEALDLLKPLTGSDAVGHAKQIKRYRDWVVHRNPRKPSPPKIDPTSAKATLVHLARVLDVGNMTREYEI